MTGDFDDLKASGKLSEQDLQAFSNALKPKKISLAEGVTDSERDGSAKNQDLGKGGRSGR